MTAALTSIRIRVVLIGLGVCGLLTKSADLALAQAVPTQKGTLLAQVAAYHKAKSLADSSRLAREALRSSAALMQSDSTDLYARMINAKFREVAGDAPGAYRLLQGIVRSDSTAWQMLYPEIDARDVFRLVRSMGLTKRLPASPTELQNLYDIVVSARAWQLVITVGSALVRSDTSAATLGYYMNALIARGALGEWTQCDSLIVQVDRRVQAGVTADLWADFTNRWIPGTAIGYHSRQLTQVLAQLVNRYPGNVLLIRTVSALAVQQHQWQRVVNADRRLAAVDGSIVADPWYVSRLAIAYTMLRDSTARTHALRGLIVAFTPTSPLWTLFQQDVVNGAEPSPVILRVIDDLQSAHPDNPGMLRTRLIYAIRLRDWYDVAESADSLINRSGNEAVRQYAAQALTADAALHRDTASAQLVLRIKRLYHLHGDPAVWVWYAKELSDWTGSDADGLALARSVLGMAPTNKMLRHGAMILSESITAATTNSRLKGT